MLGYHSHFISVLTVEQSRLEEGWMSVDRRIEEEMRTEGSVGGCSLEWYRLVWDSQSAQIWGYEYRDRRSRLSHNRDIDTQGARSPRLIHKERLMMLAKKAKKGIWGWRMMEMHKNQGVCNIHSSNLYTLYREQLYSVGRAMWHTV